MHTQKRVLFLQEAFKSQVFGSSSLAAWVASPGYLTIEFPICWNFVTFVTYCQEIQTLPDTAYLGGKKDISQ